MGIGSRKRMGKLGNWTKSSVVRKWSEWRGFEGTRQTEEVGKGSWNAIRFSRALKSFLNRPVSWLFTGRLDGHGKQWGLEVLLWVPREPRTASLTCKCSKLCSSFTFCTWASSAAEIRRTWCLGRAEGALRTGGTPTLPRLGS